MDRNPIPYQSIETLVRWTNGLRYFRIFHNPLEGDTLFAKIPYDDIDELELIAQRMGITIRKHSTKPPQWESGVTYSADDYEKNKNRMVSVITGTSWWQQPGNVTIGGVPLNVKCYGNFIEIHINRGGMGLEEKHFEQGVQVEKLFEPLKLPFIVPPSEHHNYFSKESYPEHF